MSTSPELEKKLQRRRIVVDQHEALGQDSDSFRGSSFHGTSRTENGSTATASMSAVSLVTSSAASTATAPVVNLDGPSQPEYRNSTSQLAHWMEAPMTWELLLLRVCLREWRSTMQVMVLCRPDCEVRGAPRSVPIEPGRELLRLGNFVMVLLKRREGRELLASAFAAWVSFAWMQRELSRRLNVALQAFVDGADSMQAALAAAEKDAGERELNGRGHRNHR
mmetsp:Transcript_108451/g.192084  ORF Transcript_108451/g.192084 Transcript_108451/m.192084 type:complete len:222 (-) Transcript_108451:183-848(-)